jgi:signal transduction histidine kinase
VTTVVVGPDHDAQATWAATLKAAAAAGLDPYTALRLALAVHQLCSEAGQSFVIVTLADGVAHVQTRTGHTLTVPDPTPVAGDLDPTVLHDAIAAGGTPTQILAAAVTVLERQTHQLAGGEARVREFQAELDHTNLGTLALHAELAAANQRIADLLAILSHDIRQPLGVIISYGSMLLEDWDTLDDPARRQDLGRMVSAATATTRLVEEMLTVTQFDTGALTAHPTSVHLPDAVAEALAVIDTAHPDVIVVHELPGVAVTVDPRHLYQMLVNLVSNALKYGAPPIEISVTPRTGAIEITVRDHGDGIPAEFLPHLFARYARAETEAARRHKGTGLGLYIVRQLAEANGGAVVHQNADGGGACFTIVLPA